MAIGTQLTPPCRAVAEAGIVLPGRNDTYYQADLAVTCAPPDRTRRWIAEPKLIVEVLSPSTEKEDRGIKLDDYGSLPSLTEVVLIGSGTRRVQHWRRARADWLVRNLIGDASLELQTAPDPIPLASIYANSGL